MSDAVMTVKELAARWKCTEKTVLTAIAEKKLVAFRLGKRPWRVRLEEVERYERACEAA